MRICYENYLDIAIISASPAADGSYPVGNLQDQRLGTQFRATSTASQTIYIQLVNNDINWMEDRTIVGGDTRITPEGDTRVVSLIEPGISVLALIEHNISSSATVVFTGGTDPNATNSSAQSIIHSKGMMLLFVGEMNYRYWKLVISGNDVAPSIGRLWIGNYLDIIPSSLMEFTITKKRNDVVSYSKNRQKYSSVGFGWRRFEFSFPPTEETMISRLVGLYEYTKNSGSFIFCNFDTTRDYQIVEPCYVSIDSLGFQHSERMKFSWTLVMEEEL